MKFVDEVTLVVASGHGGPGCVHFRREKFIPKGGPDGGDGGRGGDIILKATRGRRTLFHFRFKRQFAAPKGQPGRGTHKTGASGSDLVLEVPMGTVVRDAESGRILVDLSEDGQVWVAAAGGQGGKGNLHFKGPLRRTPRFAQPGMPGEEKNLKLELKLLADCGLVGLPNAGKSSLVAMLSAAKPKVANYPFTTLTPTLGVAYPNNAEPFVVADIPGLIEGAHQGAGLGHRFLRHVERTRILVHLVDAADLPEDDPLAPWRVITGELSSYAQTLAEKPCIVVLNKMDEPGARENADRFTSAPGAPEPVFFISALTGQGVEELKNELAKRLG
ncbi:MAG: GTPase ObgE [Proteobacteria bacterium]|nr:GTPase ObgE [Pseudomonadota bacterium]